MNTGEYYSRELNYLNWGYDEYYSLMDDEGRSDAKAQLDTELILNESFYEKMFCQKVRLTPKGLFCEIVSFSGCKDTIQPQG